MHGLFRESAERYQELAELGERYGSIPVQAGALLHLATSQIGLGDLTLAQETTVRARAVAARLGPFHRFHMADRGLTCWLAYFLGGDYLETAEWFDRYCASPVAGRGTHGFVSAGYSALMYALAGEDSEARRVAAALAERLRRLEPRTFPVSSAAGLAGTAVWQAGAAELAEPYRRLALDLISVGAGSCAVGPHELIVARMAALLGDDDQADEYFARSRRLLQADGRRHLLAIVDYDEALALMRRKPAGRERALTLLAAARSAFEQLGMEKWSHRAEQRRRVIEQEVERLGRASHDPTPAYPDHLTAREMQVLRLIADGRTSKEIAEVLTVSLSTVERHTSNIYHKIGARSRVDATAYALRRGLA